MPDSRVRKDGSKRPGRKTQTRRYDWEAIEREYRIGQLTISEISRRYGPAIASIRYRVKRDGWVRDLRKDIHKGVREVLAKDTLDNVDADESEIVEAASRRGADVVLHHRQDIAQGRLILKGMMQELHAETIERELYESIVERRIDAAMLKEHEANMARKAISLPQRATTLRDLTQSAQRLIALERQAFSLDEDYSDDSVHELLQAVDGSTGSTDGSTRDNSHQGSTDGSTGSTDVDRQDDDEDMDW